MPIDNYYKPINISSHIRDFISDKYIINEHTKL